MASPLPGMRTRRSRTTIAGLVFVLLAATTATIPATVAAACGSFQSRVDNAKAGSTITIPKCTFNESVEIKKRLTINAYGVIVDAGGADHGIRVEASDVTIRGVSVRNAGGDSLDAAIYVNGASRFALRDAKVYDSANVCVSLNGGSGHRILDSRLARCGKEGYFGNGISDTLFKGNSIFSNNAARRFDPQMEAGGGKIMASTGITFERNAVYDNGGPGIWFDNGVKNVVVRYNRIRDNFESGIMFEISSGAKIYSNTLWGNGFGKDDWGWGAGILISSSDNADVYKNVLAWNARGVSVISQARQLSPHTGNKVHNNVIINRSSKYVAGFYDDHGGSLYQSSSGNRGYDNRYWIGSGSPSGDRFHWSGGRPSLSSYNATLGEARGTYISTKERNRILDARNLPRS